MVKFIITKDDLYPDDIAFLKDNYRVAQGEDFGENIFEADDTLIDKLETLELAGFIKIIHQYNGIENVSDIIRCTEKVEILQGGSMALRIHILGHLWEFSETELHGKTALEGRLFRLKKAIHIKQKDWWSILDSWLSRAEDIDEISERDELVEKILTYLSRCTIYTDIEKALGKKTLYYTEDDPNVVYSLTSHLKSVCGDSISAGGMDMRDGLGKSNSSSGGMPSARRVRWVFNDYVDGPSIRKTVAGERNNRFWRIPIEKARIDFDEQLFDDGGEGQDTSSNREFREERSEEADEEFDEETSQEADEGFDEEADEEYDEEAGKVLEKKLDKVLDKKLDKEVGKEGVGEVEGVEEVGEEVGERTGEVGKEAGGVKRVRGGVRERMGEGVGEKIEEGAEEVEEGLEEVGEGAGEVEEGVREGIKEGSEEDGEGVGEEVKEGPEGVDAERTDKEGIVEVNAAHVRKDGDNEERAGDDWGQTDTDLDFQIFRYIRKKTKDGATVAFSFICDKFPGSPPDKIRSNLRLLTLQHKVRIVERNKGWEDSDFGNAHFEANL